jgi:hypothetical protein
MKMERAEFLKKAGLGSIAFASLPALVESFATPAWGQVKGVSYSCALVARVRRGRPHRRSTVSQWAAKVSLIQHA